MIAISAKYDHNFRNRRSDIYVMDDEGEGLRCVTSASSLPDHHIMSWLLNREYLFFLSYTPSHQFYTIHRESENIQPFMRKDYCKMIRKITTDRRIFFSTHGHDWMVSFDGSLGEPTEIIVEGRLTSISHDGQWFALYKDETPDFIYFYNPHTAQMRKISMMFSEPPNEHAGEPYTVSWSPNNHHLVYKADYQDLWVMCMDGTQRRKVGSFNYFHSDFRWAPDSLSIAFIGPTRKKQTPEEAPLYVTAIDHPSPRYLTTLREGTQSEWEWCWLADGKHIVYVTYVDDEAKLYKINIDTGEQRLLLAEEPFAVISGIAASR